MYDLRQLDAQPELQSLLCQRLWGCAPTQARRVGEGFYGVVYRIDLPQPPGRAIVKWYKTPGHHRREGAQLDLLRPHSRLPVPEVYGYHDGDDALPFQAMAMAWAPGINASLLPTDHPHRDRFADQLVDNLLHLHRVAAPAFDLGEGPFADWAAGYRARVDRLHAGLRADGRVSEQVLAIAQRSLEAYPNIFSEPVAPRLIHSDYNLWNILADPDTGEITAVIDPMDAGFADREMDLFHLQNADGDRFELLTRYRARAQLSAHFEAKNAFYRFWDDVKHLCNMGWYDEAAFQHYGGILSDALDRER